MEIVFLGTSAGMPTKTRNVSGIAVRMAGSKLWCLVDCGEGTQHRILNTNLSLNNLQAVFFTHVHGDHCYGLPGLLASAAMYGRTDPLTIIGPDAIREYFEITLKSTEIRLSYELSFVNVEEVSGLFEGCDFDVETVELSHRVPSFAYGFYEKNIQRKLNISKLKDEGIEPGPVWGLIQKGEDVLLSDGRMIKSQNYLFNARKPRKIMVCGDNDTPDLLAESTKTADVLIHEATYTEDVAEKVGKGPKHSSAKTISQFAENVSIRNLILTHFSPRYQEGNDDCPSIKDIEYEARKHYDGTLFLANDLDVFNLNREGELGKI